MGSPTIIALEGPDGVGKTRHLRALYEALFREGFRVQWLDHEPPHQDPDAADIAIDPWTAALHYAALRDRLLRRIVRRSAPDVLVCDRWWLSTQILGLVLDNDSLMSLAEAECRALGHPALTVVLTAPDAVLDARLAVRGTPTTDRDREIRRMYESHARVSGMPIVDTSGPVADVQGRIKSLAQSVAKRG